MAKLSPAHTAASRLTPWTMKLGDSWKSALTRPRDCDPEIEPGPDSVGLQIPHIGFEIGQRPGLRPQDRVDRPVTAGIETAEAV
ncbi:hypothetical protein M2324_000454 [Rhodovulum sulfidophilum]|uniref:hypothetical protein n=1 Tax=Rhodovulum sulfidophilum TaxID=35806 RepID=UPI0018C87094|nr:hypothetical protein [Rhodovulum sulfidophilum]MCW2302072.1 hypothetical protein [Rhodovulum sulfidophilum]